MRDEKLMKNIVFLLYSLPYNGAVSHVDDLASGKSLPRFDLRQLGISRIGGSAHSWRNLPGGVPGLDPNRLRAV